MRWQFWQERCRMGATSLVNVTCRVCDAALVATARIARQIRTEETVTRGGHVAAIAGPPGEQAHRNIAGRVLFCAHDAPGALRSTHQRVGGCDCRPTAAAKPRP